MKAYTGIGSRETPKEVLDLMWRIAYKLSEMRYVLRSGGASGADSAFEQGALDGPWIPLEGTHAEIYLPWRGFNDNNSSLYYIPPEAYTIASQIHPAWERLKQGAKKLHARNVMQVLGQDLNTPSRFVVCWTPGGKAQGGTATAIKLAQQHDIPVINLAVDSPKEIRKYI